MNAVTSCVHTGFKLFFPQSNNSMGECNTILSANTLYMQALRIVLHSPNELHSRKKNVFGKDKDTVIVQETESGFAR